MTGALLSLPLEKGGNEGGSAFFITASWAVSCVLSK